MKLRSIGFMLRLLLGVLCCHSYAGAQEMTSMQKAEFATAIGRYLVVLAQHAQANHYQNAAPLLTITSDLLRVANDICAGINHDISFPSGSVATMDVVSLLTDVWDVTSDNADKPVEVTTEKKEIIFVTPDPITRTVQEKGKKGNKTKKIVPQPVVQETIVTRSPEPMAETRALSEHEMQLLATYLAPLIEASAAVGVALTDGQNEQKKKILTTLQYLVLFARFYPEFFKKNVRVATTKALFSLVVGLLLSELRNKSEATAKIPKNKGRRQPPVGAREMAGLVVSQITLRKR